MPRTSSVFNAGGGGLRLLPTNPPPVPCSPWQVAQYTLKSVRPMRTSSGVIDTGILASAAPARLPVTTESPSSASSRDRVPRGGVLIVILSEKNGLAAYESYRCCVRIRSKSARASVPRPHDRANAVTKKLIVTRQTRPELFMFPRRRAELERRSSSVAPDLFGQGRRPGCRGRSQSSIDRCSRAQSLRVRRLVAKAAADEGRSADRRTSRHRQKAGGIRARKQGMQESRAPAARQC